MNLFEDLTKSNSGMWATLYNAFVGFVGDRSRFTAKERPALM